MQLSAEEARESGFEAPTVAYASLAQPILKSELKAHRGNLPPKLLVALQGIVLSNMGIAASAPADITAPR